MIHFNINQIVILFIVFILMFINWGFEALKWKYLMKEIQEFSFIESFKIIFAGITIGIFTPNRIGEIGGRISFIKKYNRTAGLLVTSVGSYAQFTATILYGVLGYLSLRIFYSNELNILNSYNDFFTILLLIIIIFLLWSYFNIRKIKGFLYKIKFFKKRSDQLDYLANTENKTLTKVILLSCLRYFIFISQFYFLLIVFDIKLSTINAFIAISLIYLFATLIPTTTIAELGIKGSLAIYFIGLFSENIVGIIASTMLLWIINLAIPSVFGSIFFFKKNIS